MRVSPHTAQAFQTLFDRTHQLQPLIQQYLKAVHNSCELKAHKLIRRLLTFAFLYKWIQLYFWLRKTNTEVCSFSRRVMLQLVSVSLQNGIRFFGYPRPAPLSASLTSRFPRRERYGLSTFRLNTTDGLGSAFSPVARHLRWKRIDFPNLATYLLVSASQHLWLIVHPRRLSAVHFH